MAGYNRVLPSRQVVDEIIASGNTVPLNGFALTANRYVSPRHSVWTGPFLIPSSSARLLAATAGSSNNATVLTTFAGQPDFPRAVRVAPSTSTLAAGSVLVTGVNQFGATVTDTIALGGAGAAVDGAVAFKTVSSVTLPASSGGTTNITVGLSNKFGLDRRIPSVTARIAAAVNGVVEATQPVMDATNHTAKFNTTATSSVGASLELMYLVSDAQSV